MAAFLEFFINIKPLPLAGELLLQPFVASVAMAAMVARHQKNEGSAAVRRILETTLTLVGTGLIVYTVAYLVGDWAKVDKAHELRKLLLPIWLTAGALPFIFIFALVLSYGYLFTLMKVTNGFDRTHPTAKLAVMLGLRWRLRLIHAFRGNHARQAGRATTLSEGKQAVDAFDAAQERQAASQRAKADRLTDFSGVAGVDVHGRQLDRREFDETKNALLMLASSQMGWYDRRGGRYRSKLLSILDDFTSQGLPNPHGIVLHVNDKGSAWYTYRRTTTGWVFGIGANNPPPDQWLYDGPVPPSTYPHPGDGWGPAPHVTTSNWK